MAPKGKKDFSASLNNQLDLKINSQKEDIISDLEKSNLELLAEINKLKKKQDVSTSVKVPLSQIKTVTNIRTIDLKIEQHEIKQLAENIKSIGQLQPVLLSKDNYLIAGYRRFNAFKYLDEKHGQNFYDHIYAFKLDKNFDEIGNDLFLKIQFSENEERKSLDNFDISKLFNQLIESGKTQKDICRIFTKTKGFVSSIVTLKKIDPELVRYLKEFQVYAWSYEKFIAMNSEMNAFESKFYQVNKGVIGWQPLYRIAKQLRVQDQKEAFLKTYQNRLTEEELNSEYFGMAYRLLGKDDPKLSEVMKDIKYFRDSISSLKENLSEEEFKKVEKHLSEVEKIIIKNSENIK
jgi:ParB/RepB/Spo0J family partition protein